MHASLVKHTAVYIAVGAFFASFAVEAQSTGNINLDAINAGGAYAQGFTGEGVRIGIFDSGFDTSHVAFENKDIQKLFSEAYLEKYGEALGIAHQEHGTHVAGITAGNDSVNYGVAKNASLLLLSSTLESAKIIDEASELYLKAFEAFPDVKIYNNSWGYVRGRFENKDVAEITEDFEKIFTGAVQKDKLLVFAAANMGGLAPADPILPDMRDHTKAGHIINVINIESDHLFEEGKFVHPNVATSIEGSNRALFASLWSIAAPGTKIVSAATGTTDGTIEMTGTSMAAPHVTGTLALVQQAFPWMSASQLADTVLSTAQKPEDGLYDVISIHPNESVPDSSHPNADYNWQFNRGQKFMVGSPEYSPETDRYEANFYEESAAIVFWGSADDSLKSIDALKEEAAERAAGSWLENMLVDADWELDPEEYTEAVYEAYNKWKEYFIEHCTIIEYSLGAGLLDASAAVGGIAELNINRMARWDSDKNTWSLPVQQGLNGRNQIAYTLNLAGNGVSYFTNDIDEVRWNPTLHITTKEELKAYNEAIQSGQSYEGSSSATRAPENADLPVSLVVSGTLDEKGSLISAGTLVYTGHASYSGSTDVINGATLVVNGIIDGDVQTDATSTLAGCGVVGSLTSRGTLSPGNDLLDDQRIGSLSVTESLTLAKGSTLVLDVGEHTLDQIQVTGSTIEKALGNTPVTGSSPQETSGESLNIVIRTGDYIDHQLTVNPESFFPGADNALIEEVRNANVSWAGGITFGFTLDENGYFTLARVKDSMQLAAKAFDLSPEAVRRAKRLDAAIAASGVLSGPASEFVSHIDQISESLTQEDVTSSALSSELSSAFACAEPDTHLAFDAASLLRSVRLREVSALSPLTDLSLSDIIPEADLVVERAKADGAKPLESTRTILTVGARRSFGNWALGWKLGAYYDDIELSGSETGDAQGVFASVSAVRGFENGFRIFGQALLGYGTEDRTRYVQEFGERKKLDTTADTVSLGASLGVGRSFEISALSLSMMPFTQVTWDVIEREGIDESGCLTAQSFDREFLSVSSFEAGFAFKTHESAQALFLEGKLYYRNRFHTQGDESYTWAGLRDDTYLDFMENRHAAAGQLKLGYKSTSGHEFALTLDGETGDAGDERWGAALRWSWRF